MSSTRFNIGTVGANADPVSATNTGSSGSTATGGSGVLSDAESNPLGSLAADMTATVTNGAHYFWKGGMSGTAFNFDLLIKRKVASSAGVPIAWVGYSSREGSIEINANGTLTIKDQPFAALWTSTYQIPLDTWVWVRGYFVQSATVGQARAQISLHATPAVIADDSGLLIDRNIGSSAFTDIRLGPKCSTGTQTNRIALGSWSYDPVATGLPAPWDSNQPPTSDAGADIVVDADEPFTLTGVPGDDVGVASVAWKLSGASVGTANALNRTAPITLTGTNQTYSFEVTDTGGLMTSDSVVVTVRPAATRLFTGAAAVPAISRLTE